MRKIQAAVPFDEHPSYKGGYTLLYGRYVWEFVPDHPLRNMWGWVAQHRLVAEDVIGRPLVRSKDPKIQEAVHHKDENPLNNDPANLEVMTMSAHRSYHTRKRNLEYYAARRPSREAVAEALKTMSIKKTAEHFGMSHQTLRNHYPDLLLPYKRKSPVRLHAPTPEEIAIVKRYAADETMGLKECRLDAHMAERTILRLCEKIGVPWIRKTRRGELRRTHRGKPTRRWLEAHAKQTESD